MAAKATQVQDWWMENRNRIMPYVRWGTLIAGACGFIYFVAMSPHIQIFS